MTYKNYLKHDTFGDLWYEVTIRNWNGMGNSVEDNLRMGPCFELHLTSYDVYVWGATLVEVLERLDGVLYMGYTVRGKTELPLKVKLKQSLWSRFRMWRMNRRWKKEGMMNPVR